MTTKVCQKHHHVEKIIRDKEARPMTRKELRSDTFFLSMYEPKSVKDELENEDWSKAMKEEIDQIEKNKIWTLVPRLENKNFIGTMWVYRKNWIRMVNSHGIRKD